MNEHIIILLFAVYLAALISGMRVRIKQQNQIIETLNDRLHDAWKELDICKAKEMEK